MSDTKVMPPQPVVQPSTPLTTNDTRLTKKYRTYILYYHFRAAAPLTLVFEMEGTFKEAIERAKTHCIRMNYRFIKVRPFIVDLDEREARKNDDPEILGNDY